VRVGRSKITDSVMTCMNAGVHRPKRELMRIRTIPLAALLALTMSCGAGHSSLTSTAVSGAYEFQITSSVTGGVTFVEANMAANGAQSDASGPSQVQILTLEHKVWYVNGSCTGTTPGQNAVATALSGHNIALTFNEGGYILPGQGMLTGTTVTANYSITGSSCPDLDGETGAPPGADSGGIVGNQVPALAGTFSGSLNLPNGTDDAALTLTQGNSQALSVGVALTGPVDNGTFVFTGSAVGNVVFISGSINGQALSLFGYFDRTGAFTGIPNSMLVFNYGTLSQVGLLLGQ
jgi:hypothetical protein